MNYKIKERILKNLLVEITKKYDYLLNEFRAEDIQNKKRLTYDYITELLNREGFKEKLKELSRLSQRSGKNVAIITLDLDNFKIINTSYGHEIGDIFLRKTGYTLKKISEPNWIISRIGGDEFGVAIYDINYTELIKKVQLIKNSIEKMRLKLGDTFVSTTVSMGVSVYTPDSGEILDILNKAEVGIYQSKNKGKSVITFSTEEDQNRFKALEEKKKILLKAINDDTLVPVYIQPIYSLSGKSIVGGELLLRIKSEGKVLPAIDFIDAAVTFGLLRKLEEIQLNKLLENPDINKLKDKFLFINRQLKSDDYEDLKKLIDKLSRFKKSRVNIKFVIEITENSFVENFDFLKEIVSYAKSREILFALDDFGSGLASFGYVSKVPVDIIKIDGSIIEECIRNKNHQAIIKAISVLSSELNIKTVAEFIDSKESYQDVQKIRHKL